MNDLSRFADMAEILGAIIVIGGVFFAVVQMRQIRQQRREMAAIELFRFFGRPQFSQAYHRILQLPDNLSKARLPEHEPDIQTCAMVISTTMENIGVMVYHRIVPSMVVRDLLGTSAVILWNKLSPWINDMRLELDNPAMFEWFEWLSNVMQRLDMECVEPAYEVHKDWKPSRNTQKF